MPEPEQVRNWLRLVLPVLREGSAALSLFMLAAMLVSLWWLSGWVHDCVERNRTLTAEMLVHQQAFYSELRLTLAQCQRDHPRP